MLPPARCVALFLASACAAVAASAGEPPRPVAVSSTFDQRYVGEFAVDGDAATRWASAANTGAPQWIRFDFGAPVTVNDVTINWEAAHAVEYEIQVSDDNASWKAIATKADGVAGVATFRGLRGRGRYLRVFCRRRGRFPLYSIWEIAFPGSDLAERLRGRIREHRKEAAAARERDRAKLFETLALDEIVVAIREDGADGHWYANFGYYAQDTKRTCYRRGGRLGVWSLKTGSLRLLVDDPNGSVRDPVVHYDAKKILFSWRKGGGKHFHLYEIGVDGSGLTQLTRDPFDDIEPAYLPDGDIVFVSSRCKRWVNCWLTQVAVLYRCAADGGDIRQLSANIEHDNTPWVLPDGRILYQRWEYIDRSQVHYHHLWTANPDGTGQMVLFGNMHPDSVYIDAKPIPGTRDIVLIDSPGHGAREHEGHVAVLSHGRGPDDRSALRRLTGRGFRDPYALSAGTILAARGNSLVALDADGRQTNLFALPPAFGGATLHEPRPLVAREREHVVPSRVDRAAPTGRLLLADVYAGRNMKGVARGDIKKLLVLESLPKPINYTGGMDPISYGGTFTLERLVGTVPVHPDGSAHFVLPANRAFFFVALDENDLSVKRMQSFTSVAPGESQGCIGCHEARTSTLLPKGLPTAMRGPPSKVERLPDMPDVFDYPRDIQPVLDRHCVSCHGYPADTKDGRPPRGPYAGKTILTGDRGPMFSHSYFTLTVRRQFVDGRNDPRSNRAPRTIGSSASPLMKKILASHRGVKLSAREVDTVRYWIETGAAYPGTYAALGSGMIGGYAENRQVQRDAAWPETVAARAAIQKRCGSCHAGKRALPLSLCDERGMSFWRMDLNDPRMRYSRHRLFNLTRPAQSLVLLAPLAKSAGGLGICRAKGDRDARGVFSGTGDADYRSILAMCESGRRKLAEIGRFDMPGFRPPEPYLREMRRYGVLPESPAGGTRSVDVYDIDRRYFQSLWYRP